MNTQTNHRDALARFSGSPLAILPGESQRIVGAIGLGLTVEADAVIEIDDSPHEVRIMQPGPLLLAEMEAAEPRLRRTDKALGVVRIQGGIGQRRGGDYWAGTYTEDLQDQLRALAANKSIGAIMMDIDSPGGIVYNVPETAEVIRQVRAVKPVYSLYNAVGASAAFWLGSQATKAFVIPSGEVGSHGVWSMHIDASKMYEEAGLDINLISAGKFKTEGHPYAPLGDEARAEIKRGVDVYFDMFTADLAEGRGVSQSGVLENFGQGRMLEANAAKAAGLVDGIATFGELVSGATKASTADRSRSLAAELAIAAME